MKKLFVIKAGSNRRQLLGLLFCCRMSSGPAFFIFKIFNMPFKKGNIPFNKGKTNKELGIKTKPRRKLLYMTDKDKLKFKQMCETSNIATVAKHFNMRHGDACKLQRELTDGYTRSIKNPNRKLTKHQVIKILIERMRDGVKQIDLSKKYGVSAANISNICAGRHWKHVFQGVKQKYNPEILSILTDKEKSI